MYRDWRRLRVRALHHATRLQKSASADRVPVCPAAAICIILRQRGAVTLSRANPFKSSLLVHTEASLRQVRKTNVDQFWCTHATVCQISAVDWRVTRIRAAVVLESGLVISGGRSFFYN